MFQSSLLFYLQKMHLKKYLLGYPPQLLKAIGAVDIFTMINFYAYIFSFVVVCGAIQAMNIGISIISKETRFKTADFLLTKPASRFKILTSKLSAGITNLLITNIIYVGLSVFVLKTFQNTDFDMKIFLLISCSLFLEQLIFFALRNIYSSYRS